jgi:hypothetical protein
MHDLPPALADLYEAICCTSISILHHIWSSWQELKENVRDPHLVELVLGLARHRERAGERDLDRPGRVGAQEFCVAHLDRPQPADRADDARHHDGAAGASAHGRRVVEIDIREGGRKAVRVAFAADSAHPDRSSRCGADAEVHMY